ncbi:MAG: hypothetical protein IKJ43_03585 [Bacilli bacterium]|nr:hypothetical protein [Bacilli bacterium]
MKVLIIIVLLLTGCVSNADFEKECTYTKDSNHIKESVKMNILYDNKDVTKDVIYMRSFKALDDEGYKTIEDIKEASITYNRRYGDKGIKITVSKDTLDEYEMKYYIDARNIDSETLKDFNLNKNSIKLFNNLRKKSIECEVKDGNN